MALGLLLAACGAGEPAPAPPAPQPVRLHRVGELSATGVHVATGTVRLRRETPLAFISDGRVQAIRVREGDVVRAGQALAELDRSAIDANVRGAAARLRQAEADLARQKQLRAGGWVAEARVETAEAVAESARAELGGARFTQRFSVLTAPAAGVVLARLAEPGQTLAAGTPVLVLGEFGSGFVLRVPLPAAEAAGLRRGDTAVARLRDGLAPAMAARLIEIAARADAATGTFQAEFALPAHPALKSGVVGEIELPQRAGPALLVPASALFGARAGEGFVWVRDPATGRVRARLIGFGGVQPGGVEVRAGLARGELIVAAGADRLVEGQEVRAVADGGTPAGRPS